MDRNINFVNLFTNKKFNTAEIVKELNLTEIHNIIEEKDNGILFNLDEATQIKLICNHSEKNRRDKVVWHGEIDNTEGFGFALIIINHAEDNNFDFYGEILHGDKQYLITKSGEENTVIVTMNKRFYRGRCGSCNQERPDDTTVNEQLIDIENTQYKVTSESDNLETTVAWEPFDSSRIKDESETSELKILAVYNKKTKEVIEKKSAGESYVGGKKTGVEIIEYLSNLAEDTTNTVFKNSNINTKIKVVFQEIDVDILYGEDVDDMRDTIVDIDEGEHKVHKKEELQPLYDAIEKEKPHKVAILLSDYTKGSDGVAGNMPGYFEQLRSRTLKNLIFVLALVNSSKKTNKVDLSSCVFTHELAHTLGSRHPYIIDKDDDEPVFFRQSTLNFWMRGYNLPSWSNYVDNCTVMGYKTPIPYFSSPDIKPQQVGGLAIGSGLEDVAPADVARGLRISSKVLFKNYKIDNKDFTYVGNSKIYPQISIHPQMPDFPTPGYYVPDLIADNKLKLTAVPFTDRATFSHWEINGEKVEEGKNDIIINTNASKKIDIHFKQNKRTCQVRFNFPKAIGQCLAYAQLLNEKGKIYIKTILVEKNNNIITVPVGTDLEIDTNPLIIDTSDSTIFKEFSLGVNNIDEDFSIFRVSNDCSVNISTTKLTDFATSIVANEKDEKFTVEGKSKGIAVDISIIHEDEISKKITEITEVSDKYPYFVIDGKKVIKYRDMVNYHTIIVSKKYKTVGKDIISGKFYIKATVDINHTKDKKELTALLLIK